MSTHSNHRFYPCILIGVLGAMVHFASKVVDRKYQRVKNARRMPLQKVADFVKKNGNFYGCLTGNIACLRSELKTGPYSKRQGVYVNAQVIRKTEITRKNVDATDKTRTRVERVKKDEIMQTNTEYSNYFDIANLQALTNNKPRVQVICSKSDFPYQKTHDEVVTSLGNNNGSSSTNVDVNVNSATNEVGDTSSKTLCFEKKEFMLQVGTLVTLFGDVKLGKDANGNDLANISAPNNSGYPFVFTLKNPKAVIKGYMGFVKILKLATVVLGVSSVSLFVWGIFGGHSAKLGEYSYTNSPAG
mgnify:CR=1 FL=1